MKNKIVILPEPPIRDQQNIITLEKCENGYLIKKDNKCYVFEKLKDAFKYLELELV